MKRLITAVAATLALNFTFAAELEGVKYDDQIKLGASDLVLNGMGVRSKFGKRYVAALYVTTKSGDVNAILTAKGAKRFVLTLLKDGDGKTFANAFQSGIEDNSTPAELAVIKDRVKLLEGIMHEMNDVAKGAIIQIDWIPEMGTQISLNGKPVGKVIAGEDFYRAMLKIWLGTDPVQKDLKESLLGRPS